MNILDVFYKMVKPGFSVTEFTNYIKLGKKSIMLLLVRQLEKQVELA